MKAEQTMILSASGSIRMPKLVISLCRRAINPSRKSLMPARQKSTSAIVSLKRTPENRTTTNAPVSRKRAMVSLLGRFIDAAQVAVWLTEHQALNHLGRNAQRERFPANAGRGCGIETTSVVTVVSFLSRAFWFRKLRRKKDGFGSPPPDSLG